MSSLAEPADRRRLSRTPPGAGSRLATTALLVVGAVVAFVIAGRLVAALLGWEIAPLTVLSTLSGELIASLLLVVAILVLAALVSMIPGEVRRSLWVPGERGGVLVSLAALQRLAEATARENPDVVRVRARLRERDGAPVGSLRVDARPLADATRVADDVKRRVQTEIDLVLGLRRADVEVASRALRVSQLKRYLP
jgi:hypothetical protein